MNESKKLPGLASHAQGFGLGGFMIIPQEMKNAVNQVEIQEFAKFPAVFPGLAAGGFQRDDDVAQDVGLNLRERPSLQGDGNNIGGAPTLQDGLIEAGHGRVIYQGQAQFGVRTVQAF